MGVVSGIIQRGWRHTWWSRISLTPSALSVLVVLVPHCCLCRFRGILLGLCLLLWGGLCVHKGEVGGIVRGVAGVGGEREGDGGRIRHIHQTLITGASTRSYK